MNDIPLAPETPEPRLVRFCAGHVLFRPADECPGFITVRHGIIRVSLTSVSGREIVLYRVRPGEICLQTFVCLVEGRRYGAEGVAETDVEAELHPRAAYDRLLAEDAPFRQRVLTAIAHRFADFEAMVEMLYFTGLEARVAAALLRLADDRDMVHATHEAIAMEIGSAREAVSRQLGAFARKSLVELARGRILLLDRLALVQLCEGQA